jgi:hypothetical protein
VSVSYNVFLVQWIAIGASARSLSRHSELSKVRTGNAKTYVSAK